MDHERAFGLGLDDRGGRIGHLGCDESVVDDARRVHHTVDRAETLAGANQRPFHLHAAGDVGGQGQHLAAHRLDRLDLADPLARPIAFAVPREPGFPLLAWRYGRSTHQDQPGLHRTSQMLGHLQADSSEAAGDQVDASLSELREPLAHGLEPHSVVAADPALPVSAGDYRCIGRTGELPSESVDRKVDRSAAPSELNVDVARSNVGHLSRRDPGWPSEERSRRLADGLAGDREQIVRDDRQGHWLFAFTQCLGEKQQAAEAALARPVELEELGPGAHRTDGPAAPRDDRPQMHDATGRPVGLPERIQERHVVATVPGAERVLVVAQLLEHARRPHADHGLPGQATRQTLPDSALVAEEEPRPAGLGLARGKRASPRWQIEPVRDIRLLTQPARARRDTLAGRGGPAIDPIALSLERIGGQRDSVALLVPVEAGKVGPSAQSPEAAQGLQQERDVGDGLLRVAQRLKGHDGAPLLAREAGQRPARADLEQSTIPAAHYLGKAVPEPHRLPEVSHPIGGIGCVLRANPRPRQIRHDR